MSPASVPKWLPTQVHSNQYLPVICKWWAIAGKGSTWHNLHHLHTHAKLVHCFGDMKTLQLQCAFSSVQFHSNMCSFVAGLLFSSWIGRQNPQFRYLVYRIYLHDLHIFFHPKTKKCFGCKSCWEWSMAWQQVPICTRTKRNNSCYADTALNTALIPMESRLSPNNKTARQSCSCFTTSLFCSNFFHMRIHCAHTKLKEVTIILQEDNTWIITQIACMTHHAIKYYMHMGTGLKLHSKHATAADFFAAAVSQTLACRDASYINSWWHFPHDLCEEAI